MNEDRIRLVWKDAYDVYVWGFHEAKYGIEALTSSTPSAKWLLEFVRKVLE